MCHQDHLPTSNSIVWRPDDTAQPTPSQPGSTQLYRPDILETIEAKIKEMDPELRELSLDIHGIINIYTFGYTTSTDLNVAHPELGYQE